MRRRRDEEDDVWLLTPNQVVAYNLPRARLVRGWTQEQAADALEPYLGTRWSVANFSAIERSVDGGRIRQFTADDLFALSRAFDLPIGFFLTPPGDDPRGVGIATPDTRKIDGADPVALVDAVLGTDENLPIWENDLSLFGVAAGRRALLIDGKWVDKGRNVPDQRPKTLRFAAMRTRTLLRREFGDLETAKAVLMRLAELLELLVEEDSPEEQEKPAEPRRRRGRM